MIVVVDVDEVCANLLGWWLALYNRDYNENLTPEDIDRWDLTECVKPECGKKLYQYLLQPDLYEHVLPIPFARQGVYQLLADGHRVIYASSCPAGTEQQKADWLVRWGFTTKQRVGKDFLAVSDKGLVHADFLFDDGAHNLDAFKSGRGVLVRRPHNWESHTKYLSVAGLEDAYRIVRGFTQVL